MKKVNYTKVATLFLWITAVAGLFSSLAFVSKSGRKVVARNIGIVIHNNDENFFLDEAEIRAYLNQYPEGILSRPVNEIDLALLERRMNMHPAIENCEVSSDLSGNIHLEITQRTPLVRIINRDGESYYIDTQARLMPLNENYTARVLVVSGELSEPYSSRYGYTIGQISKNENLSKISLLDDIYSVAAYINADTCLSALIHQIYVNQDREFELFPAVGNHRIVLGDAKDIAFKFNKLKLFYTDGLNKTDSWNKYETVNLKYKNLVVCTKK